VFDRRAVEGGLSRLPEAVAIGDFHRALDRFVEIFCAFWGSELAIGWLQAIAVSDPEFSEAIDARNERRRRAIGVLLARAGAVPERQRDATDLIFTLTSYATHESLKRGRSEAEVCVLLKAACAALATPAVQPRPLS
jgi:hypothetical protein